MTLENFNQAVEETKQKFRYVFVKRLVCFTRNATKTDMNSHMIGYLVLKLILPFVLGESIVF